MKLFDLAEIQMGYPFRARLEHVPDGDVAVVQMKDIDDIEQLPTRFSIRVNLPRGKGRHLLEPGDLLFRSRGRTNSAVLVSNGIGPAVLAAPMLRIRPRHVRPEYLCWFLNSSVAQKKLAGMAEGTAVQMISAEALKTLDIPVPTEAAQRLIAQSADLAQREQVLLAQIAGLRQQVTTHQLLNIAREATP